jgi:hypothetical protein
MLIHGENYYYLEVNPPPAHTLSVNTCNDPHNSTKKVLLLAQ